jgi:hypothetical protein
MKQETSTKAPSAVPNNLAPVHMLGASEDLVVVELGEMGIVIVVTGLDVGVECLRSEVIIAGLELD